MRESLAPVEEWNVMPVPVELWDPEAEAQLFVFWFPARKDRRVSGVEHSRVCYHQTCNGSVAARYPYFLAALSTS
jgi:hypothetical protein